MVEKEIIAVLTTYPYRSKLSPFEKMQVIELCEIMDFCKSVFKNNKGNWSVLKAVEFCKGNDIEVFSLYMNLLSFYKQYSERKKVFKGFRTFVIHIRRRVNTKGLFKESKDMPTLLDNSKLKPFLQEMKGIKYKYLNSTDDLFIKIISNSIDTGLTYSTLKKYYYNKYRTT
jgi:hypothetical protein